MNHEQKAADKQAPKGVEDAAKEALPHLMALVRVGYSQAAIEIADFCKDKNVSAEFMDQVISMLNSENKKKFCAELFANELAEVEQERQLPGVEECVKKAKEILADNRIKLPPTHLAEITNQIKKLINFSQSKTI